MEDTLALSMTGVVIVSLSQMSADDDRIDSQLGLWSHDRLVILASPYDLALMDGEEDKAAMPTLTELDAGYVCAELIEAVEAGGGAVVTGADEGGEIVGTDGGDLLMGGGVDPVAMAELMAGLGDVAA